MSETHVPSLFDLFREHDTFEITDERGPSIKVAFRSLDYLEQLEVMESLTTSRAEARRRFDTADYRTAIADEVSVLKVDAVITQILAIERPTAAANADLAPDGDKPEKRAEIMEKWEADRRAELGEMAEGVVREMLVERQIRALIATFVNTRFTELSLAIMVRDPVTGEPLLSADKASPKYIGRLTPKARNRLVDIWTAFTEARSDQALRQVAESAPFSQRGESPSAATDTPAATTEIPVVSPAS